MNRARIEAREHVIDWMHKHGVGLTVGQMNDLADRIVAANREKVEAAAQTAMRVSEEYFGIYPSYDPMREKFKRGLAKALAASDSAEGGAA